MVDFTAHIEFAYKNSSSIPWHVAFTTVGKPFRTVTLNMDPDALPFTHNDLKYNFALSDFPTYCATPPDYLASPSNIDEMIQEAVESLRMEIAEYMEGDFVPVVAALDYATFYYLSNIHQNVKVTIENSRPLGDELTLGVAYRKNKKS